VSDEFEGHRLRRYDELRFAKVMSSYSENERPGDIEQARPSREGIYPMKMLELIKVADLFTISNLASGLMSIFLATEGHPDWASGFLVLAVLFDSLDGKIAALLHQQNLFGKQLDSLADLVSFGVAPAFLYFSIDTHHWIKTLILIMFVTCGMLRLARYNISQGNAFEGVPITVNGVLFPTLFLVAAFVPESVNAWPMIFLVQSFLMVSSLRVRRLF
jgi:CDP-diacylglycerol--serine O-phosphatidyltransferase